MTPPTTPETVDDTKTQSPATVSVTSDTSHHTQSPFSVRTPRTPRTPGDRALNACTLDESLFARVAVHTAKCTECDKRNMDTMRRCPGCTFQVCQPCYQKRQRESKGLVHGNMPTPGTTGTAIPNGSGTRTARKKPPSSISPTESYSKKPDSDVQEQHVENAAREKESSSSTANPNARKRVARKTPGEDSSLEKSTEVKFGSDDICPTPNKRARIDASFVESTLATTVEEPPTAHATRRPSLVAIHEALTSAILEATKSQPPAREPPVTRAVRRFSLAATHETIEPTSSKTANTQSTAGRAPSEPLHSGILYEHAIKNYKEPLLTRREPVLSNTVAQIPATVKRGGKPRPSAEQIYQNIQEKVREKLNKPKDPTQDLEVLGTAAALFQLAVHSRELDRMQASTVEQDMQRKQAYTVQSHMKSASAPTIGGHGEDEQVYEVRSYARNEQAYPAQQQAESAIAHTARKNAERATAHALQEHMKNVHTHKIQGHTDITHVSTLSAPKATPTAPTSHYVTVYTVRDFVRHEATKYQNNPLLDQDDNNALFHMLQSGALIWGKQTYRKQTPEAQCALRPGLNLRLDAIDKAYTAELQVLMAEQAARMVQDLIG